MKKFSLIAVVMAVAALAIVSLDHTPKSEPVDLVNNRIGNISHLLVPTYPTAQLPNAMLRMHPNRSDYTTDRMGGLPMNVPSHREGGVTLLKPFCGDEQVVNPDFRYRYDHEQTAPYHYSVYLDDFAIALEYAPSEHSAIMECTFEQEGDRFMMLSSYDEGEIFAEGNRMWGYDTYYGAKHYFWLEFDQTPVAFSGKDGDAARYAQFAADVEKVALRYGISYIDCEQAERHLQREIPAFDMAQTVAAAREAWNAALGKIEVEGGTEDEQIAFYTALYRCHERMIRFSEEGRYRGPFDKQIHDDGGITFWTDDWVWDTYQSLHPLHTILNPKAEGEKMDSYVRMWREAGWMPTFPAVYGDSHRMNGNHSAAIFADALAKGIEFDVEGAFEGIRHSGLPRPSLTTSTTPTVGSPLCVPARRSGSRRLWASSSVRPLL